ncbi:helix-turn-helix transcriptional regulator [Xanthomonas hyacinthi]|uniref:helix-turn-helix transcriptional regulator n=1 Tax=Xanthomonas hyacinthi TaxID=56455 RepID=UPI0006596D4C|nr:helix-turn-helix transcriptional regulator [Xanthomonas hyacinthi]KLD76641.1 DNA-binding protein [Xanthomonas hyacinthi DSM 19077]
MLSGAWPQALQYLQHRRDQEHGDGAGAGAGEASLLRAIGDGLLTMEYEEEAEEAYRLAQKRMRNGGAHLRLFSCRNTAWQMLQQRRLSAALNCFGQLVVDRDADQLLRAESLMGKALSHFHLGQSMQALQVVERAQEAAAETEIAHRLVPVAQALRLDMLAQLSIRRAERLIDHVFWQAAACNEKWTGTFDADEIKRFTGEVAESMPVLARRLQFVRSLLRIAAGDTGCFDAVFDTMPQYASACGSNSRHGAKLELALAALAAGRADLAERALAGVVRQASMRWDLELEYCQAKICHATGRTEQALRLYNRYALDAVQCLRSEVQVARSLEDGPVTQCSDDISARLPAKYRRAYTYMLENVHRPDLSINEVAAQIGVTGRALQLAFKAATGMSPTQVLRRYRMQGIRDELLSESGCGGVLQAAEHWGVVSRSALVKCYRRQFDEVPAETLQR